ncbi:MAG: glycosyltransferase family 4 protein [Pseudomonadota bacterium]
MRSLARDVDHMLFISPNEGSRFAELAGTRNVPGEVMWNIGRPPAPRRPFAEPPEAVYFGSVDYSKGTDRLIDVAAALKAMQAPPLVIAIYGKARTDAGFMSALQSRIETEGLGDRIEIRGYTTDPMAAMAGAVALIRPSRDNDPWGRDVIEAARAGLPVIASGTYDGVVHHSETGYLLDPFDPTAAATHLSDLIGTPRLWSRMSSAAQKLGDEKFSGAVTAARFGEIAEAIANRT